MAAVVLLAGGSGRLAAQQPATEAALRVFLDCQATFCDQTFVRQEILWIDWVRDREDADVQVLATTQRTGGGGNLWELAFIGLDAFEGVDDTLEFATPGDATNDDERRALIQYLSLGFARYVARTPDAVLLRVGIPRAEPGAPGGPGERAPQVSNPEDDPWDFWVFQLGLNGNLNGETSYRSSNFSGSVSAGRTTEAWKLNLSGRHSKNTSEYDLSDGSTVEAVRDSWSTSGLLVRSLGPQWGIGARASLGANTYVNQDLYWSVEPGVEYNFFPYSQSSRRLLTLHYTFPINGWDYTEETIYRETEEVRLQHSLSANLSLRQPWGQTDVSLSGSQYFHDLDFYNVRLFGSTNVRLFRGFSFRVTGSYSWIRDQLYLPAGDLSDEDILTRRQALATGYNYFMSFGISYQFGSIFNNIVNPRFGGGGGGVFFF